MMKVLCCLFSFIVAFSGEVSFQYNIDAKYDGHLLVISGYILANGNERVRSVESSFFLKGKEHYLGSKESLFPGEKISVNFSTMIEESIVRGFSVFPFILRYKDLNGALYREVIHINFEHKVSTPSNVSLWVSKMTSENKRLNIQIKNNMSLKTRGQLMVLTPSLIEPFYLSKKVEILPHETFVLGHDFIIPFIRDNDFRGLVVYNFTDGQQNHAVKKYFPVQVFNTNVSYSLFENIEWMKLGILIFSLLLIYEFIQSIRNKYEK